MSTEEEKKKEERKIRKKELEQMVIELTEIFPEANFQDLIKSVEKTKGRSKNEAIEYYLTNILTENSNNKEKEPNVEVKIQDNNKKDEIQKRDIQHEEKLILEKQELKELKQELKEIDLEDIPIVTKEQEFEQECIGLDKSQVNSLKKLLEIFPYYKIDVLKQILEKKKWYYEDAAIFLVDQLDDISIERDDSFEIGEDVLEVTIDSNVTNEDWYKEALQSANEYLKELEIQNSDVNLAKKLQEEEYNNFTKRLKDQEEREKMEKEEKEKKEQRELEKLKLEKEKKWKEDRGIITGEEEKKLSEITKQEVKEDLKKRNPKMSEKEIEKYFEYGKTETKLHENVTVISREGFNNYFNPENLWKGYVNQIIKGFEPYEVVQIKNCVNPMLAKTFVKEWSKGNSIPVMCYHGTAVQNVDSIIESGLKVPGKSGIKVVNGSAYGVGIYVATSPQMSITYCKGGNTMFVCAVLVGNKYATTNHGSFMVIFDENHVIPVFTVKFKNVEYYNTVHQPIKQNIGKLISSGNPNQKKKKK